MCSRRRNAPSVPASLQRSASASNRRFSLPENWRRLAIATTSGSRRAPSPEAISPVALPAPSATASEEEPDNPFREDFTNEVMFMSTCTLNCPRQVSHLTLARGAESECATQLVNIHWVLSSTVSHIKLVMPLERDAVRRSPAARNSHD